MPHRPAYPLPNLEDTMKRIHEGVFALLTPEEVALYGKAVQRVILTQDSSYRKDIERHINEKLSGMDNWAAQWFLDFLLGIRAPISSSQLLVARLEVPKYLTTDAPKISPTQDSQARSGSKQVQVAALLIHALAKFTIRPRSSYTSVELALWEQLSGLIGTVRIPGQVKDELQKTDVGKLRHVLVWVNGRAWAVDVLQGSGANAIGVLEPVKFGEIQEKLQEVLRQALIEEATQPEQISLAAYSSRLNRSDWSSLLSKVTYVSENRPSLALLQHAIATIALEDYSSPQDPTAFLTDLRRGGPIASTPTATPDLESESGMGRNSVNRFADQTLGIVVYADGEAGVAIDHVPADFGAGIHIASVLSAGLRVNPPVNNATNSANDLQNIANRITLPNPTVADLTQSLGNTTPGSLLPTHLAESTTFSLSPTPTPQLLVEPSPKLPPETLDDSIQQPSALIPQALVFSFPSNSRLPLPKGPTDITPRHSITFELPLPSSSFPRHLIDSVTNLIFQTAVTLVLDRPAASLTALPPFHEGVTIRHAIFQPIWQQGFRNGRVDPGWFVTSQSVAFIEALFPPTLATEVYISPQGNDEEGAQSERSNILNLFNVFLSRRQEIIKDVRSGGGIVALRASCLEPLLHKHIATLAELGPEHEEELTQWKIIRETWLRLQSIERAVHFTGFIDRSTNISGDRGKEEEDIGLIHSGMSNIYLPNHLACFYLAKPTQGIYRITLIGSGRYNQVVGPLKDAMTSSAGKIFEVARGWAERNVGKEDSKAREF